MLVSMGPQNSLTESLSSNWTVLPLVVGFLSQYLFLFVLCSAQLNADKVNGFGKFDATIRLAVSGPYMSAFSQLSRQLMHSPRPELCRHRKLNMRWENSRPEVNAQWKKFVWIHIWTKWNNVSNLTVNVFLIFGGLPHLGRTANLSMTRCIQLADQLNSLIRDEKRY